jgi:hypothetical protein
MELHEAVGAEDRDCSGQLTEDFLLVEGYARLRVVGFGHCAWCMVQLEGGQDVIMLESNSWFEA